MSYGIARGSEENELRLRGSARDSTVVIPYGVNASFSADSKWLAYLVGVAPKERERLLKDKKPVRTAFSVRNFATGETHTFGEGKGGVTVGYKCVNLLYLSRAFPNPGVHVAGAQITVPSSVMNAPSQARR